MATLQRTTYHWSLHHTHLSASSLLIETSSHLSSKVLQKHKTDRE